jgi:monothiol glutaredoxin
MTQTELVREKIKGTIQSNRVVLFMKGTQTAPRCGFSAQVCSILGDLGVTFESFDVLGDATLREEIKAFSNWPTIPQLYVDGQFVGGCDIVSELYQSGELNRLLGVPTVEELTPRIQISKSASVEFSNTQGEGNECLRLEIGPSYEYDLLFDAPKLGDIELTSNGVKLRMSRATAKRADGLEIDFVEGPSGAGFKIQSPNEPAKVNSIYPKDLQKLIAENPNLELFDVRTDQEREIARIANSRALDTEGEARLHALDKKLPVFIYCHHGVRSRAFAQQLVNAGYRNVHNLEGGIDAWSREVDPSVPRY